MVIAKFINPFGKCWRRQSWIPQEAQTENNPVCPNRYIFSINGNKTQLVTETITSPKFKTSLMR